ncbi:MAG: S-layer homology domain-containing protein [Eubacteriales bacterium]
MKKLMAYALSFALVFSQVIPVFASENGGGYSDVDPGHWGADALNYAVENKLLTGTGDGKLDPDGILTRAQLAAILVRLLELDEESDTRFSDVPEGAWFSKYIAKVNKAGLMKGKGNNKMMPNAKVTREEISVILHRLLCIKGGNQEKLSNFSDSSNVSDWAKDAVSSLVDKGYMNGSDGKLNPKVGISRAQLAKLMQNTFPNIVKSEADVKNLKAGNVLVKKSVNLENVEIKGDLILSKAVKPETVLKSTVKISGRVVNPQELKAVAADKLKFTDKGELANKEILQSDNKKDDKKEENSKKDNATRAKRSHSSGNSNGSSSGNQSTAKPKADKEKLLVQIKEAEKLYKDPYTDAYNDQSLEKFIKEFEDAKKVNEETYASQKDVDDKAESLKKSMDELKKSEKNKKVKFGIHSTKAGDNFPYDFKVKVVLDNTGTTIVKVEDYGTNPLTHPDNDTKREDLEYLRRYWEKNGFDVYKGKTLDEVKQLKLQDRRARYINPRTPGDADSDAVTGATACSRVAKLAVINAMEQDNPKFEDPIPFKKETLTQVYRGVSKKFIGYTVSFVNKLPKDYEIELESVCYGIFNGDNVVQNVKLSDDGTKLEINEEVKPGYYCLNIRDKSGKYPAFNTNGTVFDEYTYPFFVIPPTTFEDEGKISYMEGKLISENIKLDDLFKNLKEIEIYKGDKEESDKLVYAFPVADKVADMNFRWLNDYYKSHTIFDETGKVDANYVHPQTGKKIFEDGQNYLIHAHLWNSAKKAITVHYNIQDATKYENPNVKYWEGRSSRYGTVKLKLTLSDDFRTLVELENAGSNIKGRPNQNQFNAFWTERKSELIGKTAADIEEIDFYQVQGFIRDGVVEVLRNQKTELDDNNTYTPKSIKKYGNDGYEITFKNSLPPKYEPRLKALFYGTRANCEEKQSGAFIDYTGSILKVPGKPAPGHYLLDIEDAKGVFGAPKNVEGYSAYGEPDKYAHFIIPAKDSNASISFDADANIFKGENISEADILKNLMAMRVKNIAASKTEMINFIGNFGVLKDEFKDGNLPLKEDGRINLDFEYNGEKVFEKDKKYEVQLWVYGFEEIEIKTGEFTAVEASAQQPQDPPAPPQSQEVEKTGEAGVQGFDYNLKVKVTIRNKKVTTVEDNGTVPKDLSNSYFQKFKNGNGLLKFLNKTLEEIKAMSMNTGDTDVISGATACSKAAQKAVVNALEK